MVMYMVHIMVMIMVNIHEAKARLSHLIEMVASGERVVLCKRNTPVAELRAISQPVRGTRPVGLAKQDHGELELPESFFDPLPDELIEGFEGRGP